MLGCKAGFEISDKTAFVAIGKGAAHDLFDFPVVKINAGPKFHGNSQSTFQNSGKLIQLLFE
jgi:hypothetical protein